MLVFYFPLLLLNVDTFFLYSLRHTQNANLTLLLINNQNTIFFYSVKKHQCSFKVECIVNKSLIQKVLLPGMCGGLCWLLIFLINRKTKLNYLKQIKNLKLPLWNKKTLNVIKTHWILRKKKLKRAKINDWLEFKWEKDKLTMQTIGCRERF